MADKLPILYSFRRCPYAMRARMALIKAEITLEHREVLLRDKPAHMLKISPKGTVPVLLLSDGGVVEQSLDIIFWALEQNDPDQWLDGTDHILIAENDGPFKSALDSYKYPARHGIENPEVARNDALPFLFALDGRLKENEFLCGPRISATDIAIFPFIRQFASVDRPWFDGLSLPALQRWLSHHLASELFERTMTRHDVWSPAPSIS